MLSLSVPVQARKTCGGHLWEFCTTQPLEGLAVAACAELVLRYVFAED